MNAGNLFRTRTTVAIPELALIAATRGMLGAGIGLLVADRIRRERRRAIGWTLFVVGALSTIPLAGLVFTRARRQRSKDRRSG
ncbi:MAG TPA: hypothetical protein VIQ62_04330 [Burkholderiales bacterium]|jgi:hypothetical protein